MCWWRPIGGPHLVEELGDAERTHVLKLSTRSAPTNDRSSTSRSSPEFYPCSVAARMSSTPKPRTIAPFTKIGT